MTAAPLIGPPRRGRPPTALPPAMATAHAVYVRQLGQAPLAAESRRTYASKVRTYLPSPTGSVFHRPAADSDWGPGRSASHPVTRNACAGVATAEIGQPRRGGCPGLDHVCARQGNHWGTSAARRQYDTSVRLRSVAGVEPAVLASHLMGGAGLRRGRHRRPQPARWVRRRALRRPHAAGDIIWYSWSALAAGLSPPNLRRRWRSLSATNADPPTRRRWPGRAGRRRPLCVYLATAAAFWWPDAGHPSRA